MSKLLCIGEVAEMLQIKISTIYDWVHRKKIRYVKVGSLLRFKMEDIKSFVEINTHEMRHV